MGHSTLDAAMIIDLEGGGMVKLQFIPESITDSKRAQFTDYDILGRSSPLKGYQFGPSRTLEFTAKFFASPEQDNPMPSPGLIKIQTDWLLSLPYPDYGGGIKPPHKCLVTIGANIQIIGVCTAASAIYKQGTPWDLGPGFTHGVEVSLMFEEVKDTPLDVWDRRGGGF